MKNSIKKSVLVLISIALIAGCTHAPYQKKSVIDAPEKTHVPPPPPKPISFISGAAINNIIPGNTMVGIGWRGEPSGSYKYYSKSGRIYSSSKYDLPEVWYILGDRFCTRTARYDIEQCYKIELAGEIIKLHDARLGYSFGNNAYQIYRGNAARIPGAPDEESATTNRSNAAAGFIMLVGAAALIAATTWASTPISSSSNDTDYLNQAREREREREQERERERRKAEGSPKPDNSRGCIYGDRDFGTCPK